MALWIVEYGQNERAPGFVQFGVGLDRVLPFSLDSLGKLSWGDGTNPHDVSLERSAAGTLNVTGTLEVNGSPVGGGGGVSSVDTGFYTAGDVSCTTGFTALAGPLTIGAAVGDRLVLTPDSLLCNNTGDDLQLDAATRVASADKNWFSSGTNTSRFPGGLGAWYIGSGFTGSRAGAQYTVQAADLVAGQVTVQLYGRCSVSSRTVFANANYPIRWRLENFKQ